ncbi:exodeoxyribonuclease V subunit gamma [Ruania halotolerans]|uniref:exodeoxyribonuclease V subunit gamma n=1 Tax=Ruania halotolerans TaxID=2897773 RepID=UPI001E405F30|nr:exodeoxyribonuclease V subunit gamma [Ruania halotolerans]UFU07034.1 exodeoxyribonuclease V subunit gamma [Ruania halotolerans]
MLHIHRSERTDALVAPLAEVLAEPPEDPFTPDVVAVPTRGIERWLAQRLSHHLGVPDGAGQAGVCANVRFDSPGRLVQAVLGAATGIDPDEDPWRSARLVWPVLETVDACLDEDWAAPLARYVGGGPGTPDGLNSVRQNGGGNVDTVRRSRRVALAQRIARSFSAYAHQRPDLVTAWLEGSDTDGYGAPVPDDLIWQPALWRRVREHLGSPSPAETLTAALTVLEADPGRVDLPDRLSVFGPTRLPEDQLRVLRGLAAHREVHLWLPHPSPVVWDAVAGMPLPGVRRADQEPAARHPLLISMGSDATELQHRVRQGPSMAYHHPAPEPPATLLGRLQRSLREDQPEPETRPIGEDDRSVQVHSCHGRARQVEVLREVLTGLFAADPSLEPRDVVVMCPDVDTFAPLITATFGAAAEGSTDVHPGQQLRVSLADRGARSTNPVLAVVETLLRLADSRVSAPDVLDLAASTPVRRRFRLSEDDLNRWRTWAVEVGVHWGEDGTRRARYGIDPSVRQGTWDAALDRVLLGVAMAEEDSRYVGAALPVDDVGSTDVDVAGRFAELLGRLTHLLARLDGAHSLHHWLDTLEDAVTLLTEPEEPWQTIHARRVLAGVRESGAVQGSSADESALLLADVRALLADRLAGRPTRSGFRTGALTVCSLEPMRAVPHRVVCLLGMDDGAFPRSPTPSGDDLLARDPGLGERDLRSEDRQIFLDAITAAGEHLVVVHTGADERNGAPRPPAVPVAELVDALDRIATAPGGGGPVRERVVTRHPLQTVDERAFIPGALGAPGPFSFDVAAFRGARAGRGERITPGVLVTEPLPIPDGGTSVAGEAGPASGRGDAGLSTVDRPVLDLDELVELLEHPAKWFVRRRLGVLLLRDEDDVDERLPLSAGPLDSWAAGDRILTAVLAGAEPRQAFQAEWRRGKMPPRQLGNAALLEVMERIRPIHAMATEAARVGSAVGTDVLAEAGSVLVAGTVPGVHGDRVVRAEYSKLGAKHRLRAWVQVLALAVTEPDRAWHTVTIGRGESTRYGEDAPAATASHLRPPADPRAVLADLVALHAEASRMPLPIPPKAAQRYASARSRGASADSALEQVRRNWRFDYQGDDAFHLLCFGESASVEQVAGTPSEQDRTRFPEETTRLGALSRRVWDPLLASEEQTTS